MLFEDPNVSRGDDRLGRMSIGEINSINFRANKYFQRKQRTAPRPTDDPNTTIKLDELTGESVKSEALNSLVEASGNTMKSLYVDLEKFYKLS
jgi:hypothetical protein